VRTVDFFVVDEAATAEINGGFPLIHVLDEDLLADLRSGPLPSISDVSAVRALCDLLEDALLEYASWGRYEFTDTEMSGVSRTFETVTDRLGIPARLPFRNFTTLDAYSGRSPSSKTVAIQAYRQFVIRQFEPVRTHLADLRTRDGLDIREDLIAKLRDPDSIREHLDRLQRNRRIEQSDPPLAIGIAKELVESTAKTVLQERGFDVNEKDDLPALVKKAQEALGLHPSAARAGPDGTDALKRTLGGLANIALGLGELRNLGYGTGHGPKGKRPGLRTRHAQLALNSAVTWCNAMLDTFADPEAPWRTEDQPRWEDL
jgi:Abortive infection C-terminus